MAAANTWIDTGGRTSLHHPIELFPGYPGFIPGLAASSIIALVASRSIARRLGIGRLHAFFLVMAVGVIGAATLFPDILGWASAGVPVGTDQTCDVRRITPSLTELREMGESAANVLLFVPLGLAIALQTGHRRAIAILAAAALPFAIEAVQMWFTVLDRRCQTADIADNLLGLAVGLAMGLLVLSARDRWFPQSGASASTSRHPRADIE